jgi:hypothetical protein
LSTVQPQRISFASTCIDIANHLRCIYKPRIVVRTWEICMISSYLQIAPSRPTLMLDAVSGLGAFFVSIDRA